MTNYGTIKIPRKAYDRHNERRKSAGLSWAEYIDGEAPDPPDVDLHPDVREQLDRIESSASTAEERTGTLERKIEELQS